MGLNPKAWQLKLALEANGATVKNGLDDILDAAIAYVKRDEGVKAICANNTLPVPEKPKRTVKIKKV